MEEINKSNRAKLEQTLKESNKSSLPNGILRATDDIVYENFKKKFKY